MRRVWPALLAAIAPAALAEEVAIPAAKDGTLYDDPQGDQANGAGEHFFAGQTMQPPDFNTRRGVIEFDVAGGVPAGATIEEVTLRLHMSMGHADPFEVALHRAQAEWGEGTSDADGGEGAGAPAEADDATWLNTYYPASFWTNPGGDFDAAPSASTTVADVGFYEWSSPGMVADAQGWLDDPASNHGWVLVGDELGPMTAKRFDSRQHAEASRHPVLVVRFSLSAAPYCFGEDCPCDNDDPAAGCANGTFGQGCSLSATGDASLSSDTLMLSASRSTPLQPGLFFQGDQATGGGSGLPFGDGLRCAGGAVVRLEVRQADAAGDAQSARSLSLAGGVSAGDLVRYQWWYRDPALSVCGSGFNLSHGVQLTWGP
jgi:hypothetical protein